MYCIDCEYFSDNVKIKGHKGVLGYCSQLSHYGKYIYKHSECPDDKGHKKTKP